MKFPEIQRYPNLSHTYPTNLTLPNTGVSIWCWQDNKVCQYTKGFHFWISRAIS